MKRKRFFYIAVLAMMAILVFLKINFNFQSKLTTKTTNRTDYGMGEEISHSMIHLRLKRVVRSNKLKDLPNYFQRMQSEKRFFMRINMDQKMEKLQIIMKEDGKLEEGLSYLRLYLEMENPTEKQVSITFDDNLSSSKLPVISDYKLFSDRQEDYRGMMYNSRILEPGEKKELVIGFIARTEDLKDEDFWFSLKMPWDKKEEKEPVQYRINIVQKEIEEES